MARKSAFFKRETTFQVGSLFQCKRLVSRWFWNWLVFHFLLYFFHYHLTPLDPAPSNHIMSPFSFLLSPSTPQLPPSLSCHPALHPWVCLCLACYFSLFIRFHIWVQSCVICLSLTGLFHLPYCSPGPSMLLQRVKFSFFNGQVVFHCINVQ